MSKPQRRPSRTWTPNQVVAHNLTRARQLRGWTQTQAADALAPYLGVRLSVPSLSAIERTVTGTRVKQFTADELVALSRAFNLPLGWWFTPPDDGALHTPREKTVGFAQLVDIVLGTRDTLPPWTEALRAWASTTGTDTDSSKPTALVELRSRTLIRRHLGDLSAARDTLRRLTDLLDELDDPTRADAEPDEARTVGPVGSRTRRKPAPARPSGAARSS
jgi:transcriptional regulator with XRE-family HTH domain